MATPSKKIERKRKSVESTFADKWKPQNEGDELAGTYIGRDPNVNGKRGEKFTAYHLQDEEGKRWSFAGAHLDSIMPQIPFNTFVWITYDGEQDTQNGPMKMFRVDVDESVALKDPLQGDISSDSAD
jgi:hypothetical protein